MEPIIGGIALILGIICIVGIMSLVFGCVRSDTAAQIVMIVTTISLIFLVLCVVGLNILKAQRIADDTFKDRVEYNDGVCPICSKPWVLIDGDENGTRLYFDNIHRIKIETMGDNYDYRMDRKEDNSPDRKDEVNKIYEEMKTETVTEESMK
jgi:hypothetical protein